MFYVFDMHFDKKNHKIKLFPHFDFDDETLFRLHQFLIIASLFV